MYILIVARGFPKINDSLQGIFEFDQAKALHHYGHKVVYLSLDLRSFRRKRKLGKYWTKIDDIDIFNISIPLGKIPTKFRYEIGKLALRLFYKSILKKYGKPDIIHAHFAGIGYMSGVLKEKLQIPLIITEHSSEITKHAPSYKQKKFGEQVYSLADSIIAVSSSLANNLKNHWNVDAKIVHNIVDTKSFHYHEKNGTSNFIFLSIGNLIPIKGFDLLISAFKNANFNKTIQLKIIGKGPERKNLQRQIDHSGLNEQIKLLGYMNRNEISKIMHECDAFVLASRGETFGVVYIEALLSGLPVIATACGGPEDFVTPENGILIQVNDVNLLTDALKKMYLSINEYDKKAISEKCLNKFSPEAISFKLTHIYKNILSK